MDDKRERLSKRRLSAWQSFHFPFPVLSIPNICGRPFRLLWLFLQLTAVQHSSLCLQPHCCCATTLFCPRWLFSLLCPCQDSPSGFQKVIQDVCHRNLFSEPQASMQTNGHSPLFTGWYHLIQLLYIYHICVQDEKTQRGLTHLYPSPNFFFNKTNEIIVINCTHNKQWFARHYVHRAADAESQVLQLVLTPSLVLLHPARES